ncbi:primosomal replication protein N [Thalassotalea psychrophila]|uniref:Replication restart protein PriB n=1 Tax=Thalassotalea psychrophila TaxID=3065647 RepID=A0ABY9TVN2_9GAMM|nr:primosomal replication protein N [Colwelliaceae bacterium SQ149]
MTENCLELVGSVVKAPDVSVSPAGIAHIKFSLEHRSVQAEDGLNRQVFVRMQVVATGQWSQKISRELIAGSNVKVSGFINRHETRNGNPILVLHASQIEMIK